MRAELEQLTIEHCSFCDGYPIGESSKETIEHYFPKNDYPCIAYHWENLFYCCDKCQSEANKHLFKYTLKPDQDNYQFHDYFYFDLGSGKLNVLEHLKTKAPKKYQQANLFLQRYGINTPKRNKARIFLFDDIRNSLENHNNPNDQRERNDFKYRYVYDNVQDFLSLSL